jgi:coenzyme F420-reducing hydrogenase beta subunit
MQIQNNGDLTPSINERDCEERSKCQFCVTCCPMISGLLDTRERNANLFGGNEKDENAFHEVIGWHLRSVVGWRINPALRNNSASGGLATWCLEKLLENGAVTRVASVRLAQNRSRGMFEFFSASSIEEIRRSSGSYYQPIEISGILKEIAKDRNERWAVVGVPCLCAGIRNLKHMRKQIPYVFGLVCGSYQNISYTEMLAKKSGVDMNHLTQINYRLKAEGRPPFDYHFLGTDHRGRGKEVAYHGLPYYLGRHAYFRLNACNFCKDVFAETADACFMDAWLPDYHNESRGTSVVVIRNAEIDSLFRDAGSKDEISVKSISDREVVQSQQGNVIRKRESLSLRTGGSSQSVGNSEGGRSFGKMNWWLQKRVQKRSKWAWRRLGRRYGVGLFWLTMLDLLFLEKMLDRVVWLHGLPSRFRSRIRTFNGL